MLVLKRAAGQTIHIGPEIVVTIVEVDGGRVLVGIDAPRELLVLRDELVGLKDDFTADLPF